MRFYVSETNRFCNFSDVVSYVVASQCMSQESSKQTHQNHFGFVKTKEHNDTLILRVDTSREFHGTLRYENTHLPAHLLGLPGPIADLVLSAAGFRVPSAAGESK